MANGECPFSESIRAVLELPVADKEKRARLKKLGVETTLLNAIHLELGEKAAAGDLQAAKYLRDTALVKQCAREESAGAVGEIDLTALTDEELMAMAAAATAEEP